MPDRIQLSRAKGYRRPEGTIQVDRATIFGNPWQVGAPGTWWMPREGKAGWEVGYSFFFPIDHAAAVDYFGTYLRSGNIPLMPDILNARGRDALRAAMAMRRTQILARLPSLRGHTLGCRCAQSAPCHADVLLELANA